MSYPHAIRDPIHGYVRLTAAEIRGIDTPEMQRLRGISQLGLTERVYPGARHSRFEHAIGALEVVTRILEELRGRLGVAGVLRPLGIPPRSREYERLLETARWAALLHDIGHAPFSHVTEELLPGGRRHEDLAADLVRRGPLDALLGDGGGSLRDDVLRILSPGKECPPPPLALIEDLISGPVGADRMDYLLRDSAATGVSYGIFDLDRVLRTLTPVASGEEGGGVRLGLVRGGVLAVEGMLWARVSMFQQVYCHRTRRILDRHLVDFLRAALPGGAYPDDLGSYLEWSDARIWEMLRLAAAEGRAPGHADARRILERRHHRALTQEIEVEEPELAEELLDAWQIRILEAAPEAHPIADLVLPPPEKEAAGELVVLDRDGRAEPLRQVSGFLARLRQRPLGRMYIAPEGGPVPGWPE